MIEIRLLTDTDIVRETIVGGNVDITNYVSDILNIQRLKIRPLLGPALYKKICEDFESQSLAEPYLTLYNDHVKYLTIHGATELYLAHGAYKITDAGIVKHRSDDYETIAKEEIDFLIQSTRKLYTMYETEFIEYMEDWGHLFSEWKPKCIKKGKTVGGWRLK